MRASLLPEICSPHPATQPQAQIEQEAGTETAQDGGTRRSSVGEGVRPFTRLPCCPLSQNTSTSERLSHFQAGDLVEVSLPLSLGFLIPEVGGSSSSHLPGCGNHTRSGTPSIILVSGPHFQLLGVAPGPGSEAQLRHPILPCRRFILWAPSPIPGWGCCLGSRLSKYPGR